MSCVAYQPPARRRDPTSGVCDRHRRPWRNDDGIRNIQRRLLLALGASRLEADDIAPLAHGVGFGERVEYCGCVLTLSRIGLALWWFVVRGLSHGEQVIGW